MDQIPGAISDNWLVAVGVTLWSGVIAIGTSKNKENLWLFGKMYSNWKSRRIRSIEQRDRVESALVKSLRQEIKNLSERLTSQENELASSRRETLELMRYVVDLKREAVEEYSRGGDGGGLSQFPEFHEWRNKYGSR